MIFSVFQRGLPLFQFMLKFICLIDMRRKNVWLILKLRAIFTIYEKMWEYIFVSERGWPLSESRGDEEDIFRIKIEYS